MKKNEAVYDCKKVLVNSCNPNLNRQVGLTIFAVHYNQGLNDFCCNIDMEVPELNTYSCGNGTKVGELNQNSVKLLRQAAAKIQRQIDELLIHRHNLIVQAELIQSGEIDITSLAKEQITKLY